VFASHFPSDEVQNEAEIRGSFSLYNQYFAKHSTQANK